MSRRDEHQLIEDMRLRIERIPGYTDGMDRQSFLVDFRTADAVVRNIEIIGEIAARLPAPFKERNPDVPWRQMAGLRNRIVHACFDVDLEIIWVIATREIPELKVRLTSLCQGQPETP